jgi:putative hydrolase of the HAD superfamily
MIQAVIFDLDNTLLDFMNMKIKAVESAVHGMIEAGLQMEKNLAKNTIFKIYEKKRVGISRSI